MEALQTAEAKIAQQRYELQEHQHELETLQAKIVSTSNATANTGFQEDSMGMTPPLRNMLTPERSQEWDALGVHGGNCCLRETPTEPWTTVKSRRLTGKTFTETPQLED